MGDFAPSPALHGVRGNQIWGEGLVSVAALWVQGLGPRMQPSPHRTWVLKQYVKIVR